MGRLKLTREMCYAAGQDAANRSMRNSGRTCWDETDWNIACAEFERLSKFLAIEEAQSDD